MSKKIITMIAAGICVFSMGACIPKQSTMDDLVNKAQSFCSENYTPEQCDQPVHLPKPVSERVEYNG